MPPVTPSAISATSLLGVCVDLLDLPRDDFFLSDRGLLAIPDHDAGNRAVQELAGARTCGDDELEGIGELAAINHMNLSHYFTRHSGLVPASSRAPPWPR